ncbi:FMN-linked oxidoreductase [Roridomyces roridus]|uniref:FMN-linked oxidoreductase n=1 Tax=Roridomyces roridus TaxID=1738132 RepID=A0AAD7BAM0_9AGAR|nr:FMN-linked oxidoreductase [Roridomyces roridus]
MSRPERKLFTPIRVGDLTLSHRVVLAPMTRLRVDANTGVILPGVVREMYAQRASMPGTLLISEGTLVAKKAGAYVLPVHAELEDVISAGLKGLHAASPGIWSEEQVVAWREVTDAVHARGSFIYCQLFGMGRAATSPELLNPDVDFDLVSASAIPLPGETIVPRELTVDEIKEYVEFFVAAAQNAMKAGFDGVEIHGANGYLLDAFLQDTANQRTDAYGGSPENRARFFLEVVDETVKAIGASKVGVRFSPWSEFQGMLMDDPLPTFTYAVRSLLRYPDLAFIHIVEPRISGAMPLELNERNAAQSNDFIRDLWRGRTLISAGGYTRETALERAEEEENELVAFGRHFLANPDLPARLVKDISLAKGDRSKYYLSTMDPEGYTSYPFSSA